MSGIAGIIHFDGGPVAPGLLEAMTATIAYRGPDGIKHRWQGAVAFGHCMLHTTAESLEENQPLVDEDSGLMLVMDGRVDNWETLRRKLLARGVVLRDRSDAELVLRAYQAWGKDCLLHIEGDFALVLWDQREQQAFCARDRLGHKPFYYHWNGKTFAFASDLAAILALPWVERIPNEGMLAEFLAFQHHSLEETLWNGVMRLAAAHRMGVAGSSGPKTERFWQPELDAPPAFRKDEDYIEHYRALLLDSVRRLSRSHRPVAIDVSGGLDSSALFSVAEHLRRNGMLPAPAIEGYTLALGAEDGAAYELPYARAVGEHWGVKIHEVPAYKPPLSWFAERARAEGDFPGFPNAALFHTLLQQAVDNGSRVRFAGEGGDEWLQGSLAYYAEELAQGHWRALCDCFRADAAAFGSRQALAWLVRYGMFPLLPLKLQNSLRSLIRGGNKGSAAYWLSPKMQAVAAARRSPTLPILPARKAGLKTMLELMRHAFANHISEQIERLDARAGIETRYPFDDISIVQHAFATPERLRLRGGRTKYIHIHALQDLMPKAILDRRSKAEFSNAFYEYLRHMDEWFGKKLPQRRADWLDANGMVKLLRAYHDCPDGSAGGHQWILWSIYACDLSCRCGSEPGNS